MEEMRRARVRNADVSSFFTRVTCPRVVVEGEMIADVCEVTISYDPQVIEEWLQNRLYKRATGDQLCGVKESMVFMDMEQSGPREARYTGEPAVMQVGVPSQYGGQFDVLMAHIKHMDTLPSTLVRMVEDERVLKMFHGFDTDIQHLKSLGLHPRACVQINSLSRLYLYRVALHNRHRNRLPLDHLIHQYLGLRKDQSTYPDRYWSDYFLHPYKIRYGAFNVWFLWRLWRNLVIRLKAVMGAETAHIAIRGMLSKRIEEFTIGGVEGVRC